VDPAADAPRLAATEGAARAAQGDWALAIAAYERANRVRHTREAEEELRRLRLQAFRHFDGRDGAPPEPDLVRSAAIDPSVGLPTVRGLPGADVVRASIAAHGSLLVRNLLPQESVERLLGIAKTALAARDAAASGEPGVDPAWLTELPGLSNPLSRGMTAKAGMLAVDSPRGLFLLIEELRRSGLDQLSREVLGGPVAFSAEKTVFRRVEPMGSFPADLGWHQDGAFLGEQIRTLDVWVALSRCGTRAPGLEVLSRRVDRILRGGALFSWDLSTAQLEEAYPGFTAAKPEFEPGDAILFDQLCVHRSAFSPSMTETRFALECWMFAPGTVPPEYTGFLL
jgi:hypothetical protein